MSTPSPASSPSNSPSPPQPPPPPPSHSTATPQPAARKPQPAPWSHQETVLLIQAYQEKWYSLKRGQLKAGQWEELAATLAARFGYDPQRPAKSAIQCRHKMEKLRRRYREEKRRVSIGASCFWPFFDYMDSLEHGPSPIPARPTSVIPSRETNNNAGLEDEEEEDEEEEEEDYGRRSKSRSINYILRKPSLVNRFAGSGSGSVSYQEELMRKRRREREKEEEEEEEEEEGRGVGLGLGLAEEIRTFAERMMRVERKKMTMMRETERWRMEMENKRIEMILDSQRKMVDMIAAAAADMGSRQEIQD